MHTPRRTAATSIALILLLAACGGGGGGGGSVAGTVAGKALAAKSAFFVAGTVNNVPTLALRISDQPDECALFAAGKRHPGTSAFVFVFTADNSASNSGTPTVVPPGTGDYPVVTVGTAGKSANVSFSSVDGTCTQTLTDDQETATDGKVTITRVDGNSLVGTFTLTVGSQGDPVTGSFEATVCPTLLALEQGSLKLTCG